MRNKKFTTIIPIISACIFFIGIYIFHTQSPSKALIPLVSGLGIGFASIVTGQVQKIRLQTESKKAAN